MGKSFLKRVDRDSGHSIVGTKRKSTNPTGMQIYKDLNNAIGVVFRMIGGFLGVDVDKYVRKGSKRVNLNGRYRRKSQKKKGILPW